MSPTKTGATFVHVLVSLVCCNKMPLTGWLNQQKFLFFFHSLEARKSEIMVPAWVGSGDSFVLASGCILMWQRQRERACKRTRKERWEDRDREIEKVGSLRIPP